MPKTLEEKRILLPNYWFPEKTWRKPVAEQMLGGLEALPWEGQWLHWNPLGCPPLGLPSCRLSHMVSSCEPTVNRAYEENTPEVPSKLLQRSTAVYQHPEDKGANRQTVRSVPHSPGSGNAH